MYLMKKKLLYGTFIIVFILMTVLIVIFRTKETIPYFKERNENISNAAEWVNSKSVIEKLIAEIKSNPENEKAKLNLGLAYIQESRITGNHGYYDNAAMILFNQVLEKNPDNYQAWCGKGTVLLSQHHFAEGLAAGKKSVELNPYNSFSYGILVDAYIELGHYSQAIQMADKMVSVRPDLRSYSRISYLREIFGNYKSAIDAMTMAVDAGVPGFEQTEWTRVNLGHLKEISGDLIGAEKEYTKALWNRPGYTFALAGMGRIEKYKGNYKEAINNFEKARSISDDYSFNEELSFLYAKTNQLNKSKEALEHAIDLLNSGNPGENTSGHGHYADRELAMLYLKANDTEKALQHALIEYNRRPENIDVNQTLAWVYYKKGEYSKAEEKIKMAMRTNSQNPVLLYQAGLINLYNGDKQKGKILLDKANSINSKVATEFSGELINPIAMKN
jgi:tetratricopeptide (TPR) repeat protein